MPDTQVINYLESNGIKRIDWLVYLVDLNRRDNFRIAQVRRLLSLPPTHCNSQGIQSDMERFKTSLLQKILYYLYKSCEIALVWDYNTLCQFYPCINSSKKLKNQSFLILFNIIFLMLLFILFLIYFALVSVYISHDRIKIQFQYHVLNGKKIFRLNEFLYFFLNLYLQRIIHNRLQIFFNKVFIQILFALLIKFNY